MEEKDLPKDESEVVPCQTCCEEVFERLAELGEVPF